MTREIVVGSTWAHGLGEVTVASSNSGHVCYADAGIPCEISEASFRRLFRHVRDPGPVVKVGTWWKMKSQSHFDAVYIEVLSDAKDGFVKTLRTVTHEDVSVIWLRDHYVPCEPPPREKAMAEFMKKMWCALTNRTYENLNAAESALRAYEEASK